MIVIFILKFINDTNQTNHTFFTNQNQQGAGLIETLSTRPEEKLILAVTDPSFIYDLRRIFVNLSKEIRTKKNPS